MAVSNIEWKDVATVVEPAVAKCLNPGLRERRTCLTEEAAPSFVCRPQAPRGGRREVLALISRYAATRVGASLTQDKRPDTKTRIWATWTQTRILMRGRSS